jgi:hypothetical protein
MYIAVLEIYQCILYRMLYTSLCDFATSLLTCCIRSMYVLVYTLVSPPPGRIHDIIQCPCMPPPPPSKPSSRCPSDFVCFIECMDPAPASWCTATDGHPFRRVDVTRMTMIPKSYRIDWSISRSVPALCAFEPGCEYFNLKRAEHTRPLDRVHPNELSFSISSDPVD